MQGSTMKKTILLLLIILQSWVYGQDLENVAVLDLSPEGISDSEARILSSKLRSEAVKSKLFDVIDRGNMDAILKEQSFQLSGCTTGECVVEIGQLLGVQKIISGTVGKFGSIYIINISLTNIETGKIEKQIDYELQGVVELLLTSGISNSFNKLIGLNFEDYPIKIEKDNKNTLTTDIQTRNYNTSEKPGTSKSYFTRDSHQDDVLRIQGTPKEINTYSSSGYEIWGYGNFNSVEISLNNKRVLRWKNNGILKVRL